MEIKNEFQQFLGLDSVRGISSEHINGPMLYFDIKRSQMKQYFTVCAKIIKRNLRLSSFLKGRDFDGYESKVKEDFIALIEKNIECLKHLNTSYLLNAQRRSNFKSISVDELKEALNLFTSDSMKYPLPVVFFEDFSLNESIIGSGTYGTVYSLEKFHSEREFYDHRTKSPLTITQKENPQICFKHIRNSIDQVKANEMYHSKRSSKTCMFIVKYKALVLTESGRFKGYLLEQSPFGTIKEFFDKHRSQLKNMPHLLRALYSLAFTLNEFHELGYLHMDFKWDNVLAFKKDDEIDELDENYFFKIADFGLMTRMGHVNQLKKPNRLERCRFLPCEIYEPNLIEFKDKASVDFYGYGVFLRHTLIMFSGPDYWLWYLLLPMIIRLTCENPAKRFTYRQIASYFIMLQRGGINKFVESNEIITTLVIPREDVKSVSVPNKGRGIMWDWDEDQVNFFIRSQRGKHQEFVAQYKMKGRIPDFQERFKSITEIKKFSWLALEENTQFLMSGNIRFYDCVQHRKADIILFDNNWSEIHVEFFNGIDSSAFVNQRYRFRAGVNLETFKKLIKEQNQRVQKKAIGLQDLGAQPLNNQNQSKVNKSVQTDEIGDLIDNIMQDSAHSQVMEQ